MHRPKQVKRITKYKKGEIYAGSYCRPYAKIILPEDVLVGTPLSNGSRERFEKLLVTVRPRRDNKFKWVRMTV